MITPPGDPGHTPFAEDDGRVAWLFMLREDAELILDPFLSPMGARGRERNAWKLDTDLGYRFQPDDLGAISLFRTRHPDIRALRVYPSSLDVHDTWGRLPIKVPYDLVQKYSFRARRPVGTDGVNLASQDTTTTPRMSWRWSTRALRQDRNGPNGWWGRVLELGYPEIEDIPHPRSSPKEIAMNWSRADLPLCPRLTHADVALAMEKALAKADSPRARCLRRAFDAARARQARDLAELATAPPAPARTRARL